MLRRKTEFGFNRGKPSSGAAGPLQRTLMAFCAVSTPALPELIPAIAGGLDGIPEARALALWLLGVPQANAYCGGNSSLTLMHQAVHGGDFLV